mmetsp:Transcript_10738/g.25627  ORF Transcript_10738/g.25627 Transcript_10738/m.25627 type:complete len:274 (+) Transcript_10738:369-1190(+)
MQRRRGVAEGVVHGAGGLATVQHTLQIRPPWPTQKQAHEPRGGGPMSGRVPLELEARDTSQVEGHRGDGVAWRGIAHDGHSPVHSPLHTLDHPVLHGHHLVMHLLKQPVVAVVVRKQAAPHRLLHHGHRRPGGHGDHVPIPGRHLLGAHPGVQLLQKLHLEDLQVHDDGAVLADVPLEQGEVQDTVTRPRVKDMLYSPVGRPQTQSKYSMEPPWRPEHHASIRRTHRSSGLGPRDASREFGCGWLVLPPGATADADLQLEVSHTAAGKPRRKQ